MYNRRDMLKAAMLLGMGLLKPGEFWAGTNKLSFRVGACDWSIGQTAKLDAFAVGRQIGLDGVQVSLGTLADNMQLTRPAIQQAYKKEARRTRVSISGLALGILNKVPYKSDPRAEQWVSDAIDAAVALGVQVILLAFFEQGDIKNDFPGQNEVIKRLQKVAPKAEKAGVVLGIESWLSAREHKNIIEAVGSKNVKVYYDVANSNHMGYNIYDEIRWLGKGLICEVHAKENGFLLGQGKVDFKEVRQALDNIGYSGWIQIEGAIPPNQQMLDSYLANNKYLRSVLS